MFETLRSKLRSRPASAGAAGTPPRDVGGLLDEGYAYEGKGDLASALRCYESAVATAPESAAAHLNVGNALAAMGDAERAFAAYAKALALDPDYAAAHYNTGNVQAKLGHREQALASFRKAIGLKPDFADAEVAQGNVLEDQGELEDAAASYRRALIIRPDYAEVHANLAQVLLRLGREHEALASFRSALDHDPELFAAHYGLATLLRERGDKEPALAHYRRCLELQPEHIEALTRCGDLLIALDRGTEAVDAYRRALALAPQSFVAHNNLGQAQLGLRQYDDALASFRSAVAAAPDQPQVLVNLGAMLLGLARIDEALLILQRALALAPQIALAHFHLATALHLNNRYDEAIERFRAALAIDPESADTWCNLGSVLSDVGRLDDSAEAYRRAIELRPDHVPARSNLLFVATYRADQDRRQLLAEARRFGDVVARVRPAFTEWSNPPDPGRRLRVGVVSADLRRHAAGYFAESAILALAASADAAIDVYGYYNHLTADDVTGRISGACRGWRPVGATSDEDLAAQVRADGIDILIDLSGHTAGNRLPAFGYKPAPVQATWLGYWATTGLPTIDYLIADPWTVPEGDDRHFTERIWRLPETRLCFTAPAYDCAVGASPALANGFVTFGSFNRLAKIGDDVIAVWARVLEATPGSRLLLKCTPLGDEKIRDETAQRFARHGVDASRLSFEGHSERSGYLASYHSVDIGLDPFPFSGGATSAEALWMGVPVLTLAGDTFIARQGVGLMMNAGLPEWVAADRDDYVARAVTHAADLGRLAALRAGLRQQVLASPAFDAPRFARHFAAALRGMWRVWCEQRPARI